MIIAPDFSVFQKVLDTTFNRRVGIFRIEFGANYLDPHFLHNANVAREMYLDGEVDGFIGYQVFLDTVSVAAQYEATWKAIGPQIPEWLLGVMTDMETWRGQSYAMHGNKSAAANALMGRHAHRFGSWNAAPWYGNEGDINELIPQRDPRLWGILAAYTGDLHFKRVKGARGQQYGDGQPKYRQPRVLGKTLPLTTRPFGACDHNYLDFKNGKALRAFMRPGVTSTKPKPTKPVVKPPKPPTVVPAPYRGLPHGAGSPDGHWGLFMQNDGSVERRHNSKHVDYLVKGA